MPEPEELVADAARHATMFARDLWRRHRGRPDVPQTLALADVASRLDLLITAVFGTVYPIRIAQPPAPPTFLGNAFRPHRGPRVQGAVPATDGTRLWLVPNLKLNDAARAFECYKSMALQQAARAHRGSTQLLRADWPPLLADVYLLLEADAADAELLRWLPGLAGSIEALRAAALGRRPALASFRGPRRDLERLARSFLESPCGYAQDTAVTARTAATARTPQESLTLAQRLVAELAPDPLTQRAFGSCPLFKDWWTGELRMPDPQAARHLIEAALKEDEHRRAPPRSSRLRRSPKVREPNEHEHEEHDDPGIWMVQVDEPHQHAEDPMGMKRPDDRDEDASAEELGDLVSDLPEARLIATPGRPQEILMSDDPPEARATQKTGLTTDGGARVRYPEWDYRVAGYREPGVTIRLSTVEPGPQRWVDETLIEHRAMLARIRRHFEMLRARRSRQRRQLDGDEIDLEAYVESRADLRAGGHSAEALYERRRPAERSLAIMLLIDISGSTDGWIAADRRVIDVEREALLLVCVALQELGEPYAVEAFSGEGPQGVTVRTVKRFDEPYGNDIARRIAALEPEHYTRAGAAVRHASALLMREPAAHRLLLLLSDGKPNDVDDYGGRYGAEDMRQAVIEAKLQGVSPFCLTIDRQAAAYLPHVFGAHQYALLTKPELLPTVLVDWMKRLIVA